jgi:hypothetical protein
MPPEKHKRTELLMNEEGIFSYAIPVRLLLPRARSITGAESTKIFVLAAGFHWFNFCYKLFEHLLYYLVVILCHRHIADDWAPVISPECDGDNSSAGQGINGLAPGRRRSGMVRTSVFRFHPVHAGVHPCRSHSSSCTFS